MKPLNLDNSPCSPISSNCVIWQGPDIPCIKLCKGDTVSDVIYKLATELCDITDTLSISNYDLSCFNLTSCAPGDFQALINFLIQQICDLQNVTVITDRNTPASGCPDNCIVTVADCLGGGTDTLTNYVQTIANKICNIIDQIGIQQLEIDSLDIRVTALENAVPPSFVIPSFILQCDIGSIIPVLPSGSTQDIDIVLERFINEEWCPMKAVLGTYTDLSNAIASQSPCYDGTVVSLQYQYTTAAIMQVAYPTFTGAPTTLAQAIENIWISLCDLRNAGKELTTVTAGDNVTVNTTVSVVGNDQVTQYEINAKDTVVTAGDNITVTSVTSPTDVTTYTINGKESIVVGSGDITVTPVTVGNDTTYTVARTPKINFYNEVISSVDLPSDPGFIDLTYFSPVGYNVLTFTNTSGVTKDFMAQVSVDSQLFENTGAPNLHLSAWVDTALILNPGVTLYESRWRPNLEYLLWDTVTNLPVDGISAQTVITTPGGNPITSGIGDKALIPNNASFFKKVTLNAGQTITVMFKGKTGISGNLLKAQLFVQEL